MISELLFYDLSSFIHHLVNDMLEKKREIVITLF